MNIDMTDEQLRVIEEIAESEGMSAEEYALAAIIDRLEDDLDSRKAEASYIKWLGNPETISHENLAKTIGLR